MSSQQRKSLKTRCCGRGHAQNRGFAEGEDDKLAFQRLRFELVGHLRSNSPNLHLSNMCVVGRLPNPPKMMSMLRVIFAALLLSLTMLITQSGFTIATATAEDRRMPKVNELIERLGSDSYATRIRARDMLQRLGLEAFDELHSAQYHDDGEIAAAARFLVSSLLVSWSKETDPPEVRDVLNEYGAQDFNERYSRIQLLAELPDRKGLAALARLVRFETDLRLSREAALSLMKQPMSDDQETRKRHAQTIGEVLRDNDRQAAEWLRVYAEDLAGGQYSAELWSNLIAQQRRAIDSAATNNATRASVLSLVRVCAERAASMNKSSDALALAIDNVDLIAPKTSELTDASSWAIDNQLHQFVLHLRAKHERMFDQHPRLLYAAAEALKVEGDDATAEKLAGQALEILPFPATQEEKDKLSESALEEIAHAHRDIGQDLKARGLFHWAEREFRLIIDEMEITSLPGASARQHLARMQGERLRHDDVVQVLQPLVDRMENDRALKNKLMFNRFPYDFIRSEIEYHRGLAKLKAGELEEAKQFLVRAWGLNRQNIDILITMYRVESDDEWTKLIQNMLTSEIRSIESDIRVAESRAKQKGRLAGATEILAEELNQYAWLIANTEGDYERALKESLRSLELTPDDPAKLDTCARCYFALKKYDLAVQAQRKAVRLEPHSPPMERQLAEFEKAAQEASQQ